MNLIYRKITEDDGAAIAGILNHYVRTGYQAYIEHEMTGQSFAHMYDSIKNQPNLLCVDEESGSPAGFCFVREYSPLSTFRNTVKITYFLMPEYTGQGIGGKMLELITDDCKKRGIKNILASISSLNPGSVNFHARHGFVKCGEFRNIISKNGTVFSEIWMQKEI